MQYLLRNKHTKLAFLSPASFSLFWKVAVASQSRSEAPAALVQSGPQTLAMVAFTSLNHGGLWLVSLAEVSTFMIFYWRNERLV